MRIAAASSDGKLINQHFGHAKDFYIFEKDADRFRYLELRTGKPFCNGGEHDDDELEDAINLIEDCSYVLVTQIGNGAELELNKRGIIAKIARGFFNDCLIEFHNELAEGNQ
ncbi:MAG: dinitrogenase iron-molybdenum cofactor biosynthesis protein [Acetobacterium woodii]|nr:dinitrogenase iron-molybdenum cofactor biosynthesis protein [Acetobacterium woodii]